MGNIKFVLLSGENLNNKIEKNRAIKDCVTIFIVPDSPLNEYFFNELSIDDVSQALSSIENNLYPISENGCFTIVKTISFKDNYKFIEGVYDLLKLKKDTLTIDINNKKYDVCIDDINQKKIEGNIYQLITEKIQYKIDDFVYGK